VCFVGSLDFCGQKHINVLDSIILYPMYLITCNMHHTGRTQLAQIIRWMIISDRLRAGTCLLEDCLQLPVIYVLVWLLCYAPYNNLAFTYLI
jgi:hypothetical protein